MREKVVQKLSHNGCTNIISQSLRARRGGGDGQT